MEQTNRLGLAFGLIGVVIAVGLGLWIATGGTQKEESAQVPEGYSLFTSAEYPYTLEVPDGYTVDMHYTNDITPQLQATGVSFTVPASMTEGTNLSSDTKLTVEWIPMLSSCRPEPYVDFVTGTSTITQNGATYLVASSSDAGAGNLYEQVVYMPSDFGPCLAIRYFIHTTQIGNYPAGTVREYDRAKLLEQFDHMRLSLKRTTPVEPGASEPAVNQ